MPSRASFSADTLIATPDGDKPISEIEVGDVILAYSEATEEVDLYHVSATHTQRHDSTLDITIDGETLHTTDEHPFYVIRDNEEQWVEAKHLHIGDAILSGLGETGTVEDIIIIDQPQMMYNLTVALVATYLVGDGQWVVHNVEPSSSHLIIPSTDRLPVDRVFYTQDTFTWAGPIKGTSDWYIVWENAEWLYANPGKDLPYGEPIQVFTKTSVMNTYDAPIQRRKGNVPLWQNLTDDNVYSLDNRRLVAYKLAQRTDIPVRWANLQKIVADSFKFTTDSLGRHITAMSPGPRSKFWTWFDEVCEL